MNLAVKNWLRRARLVNRKEAGLPVIDVEEPDLIDVSEIMVTVDDADAAVSSVEASEIARAKVSGTPVSFVLIDD
jgi:hypothetical protein